MPNRCVVGGCSNVTDAKNGISLHFIPFAGDERPEAKRRRKQWVDFVRLKRAKWDPTTNSSICSAHFAKEDFTGIFSIHSSKRPRLTTDEIGIVAIPKYSNTADDKPLSARAKRMVVKEAVSMQSTDAGHSHESAINVNEPQPMESQPMDSQEVSENRGGMSEYGQDIADESQLLTSTSNKNDISTETGGCVGCAYLIKERRKTWNKYITLKAKYDAMIKVTRSKVSVVLAQERAAKATKSTGRAPPRCAVCKNLMKGHKNIKDCPKNQK